MKNKVTSMILRIMLYVAAFAFVGCTTEQLGETRAEGHRRHLRNMRISRQALMEDIDMVLLMDRPTRLADKKVP